MRAIQWKRAVANGFATSQETPPLAQLVGMKMDIRENGADHNAIGLALSPSNSFPTIWVCPEDVSRPVPPLPPFKEAFFFFFGLLTGWS